MRYNGDDWQAPTREKREKRGCVRQHQRSVSRNTRRNDPEVVLRITPNEIMSYKSSSFLLAIRGHGTVKHDNENKPQFYELILIPTFRNSRLSRRIPYMQFTVSVALRHAGAVDKPCSGIYLGRIYRVLSNNFMRLRCVFITTT